MSTNGSAVYRISIGRLYRTCGGSLLERLRWNTTAHKISPHTTKHTANPAIHEPCHRVRVTNACLVMGGGKPSRVNVLSQPDRAAITRASAAARGTQRRAPPARPRRRAWRIGVNGHAFPVGISRLQGPVLRSFYSVSCKQYRASPPACHGPPVFPAAWAAG